MDSTTRPFWGLKYGSDARFKGYSRLTRQGYISVGWTYAGDLSNTSAVADIEKILNETMPAPRQYKENIIRRDAGILNAFINIAQVGDFVACHDTEEDKLFIGRIKGPCVHDTLLHRHLHLLREVEWIEPLHIIFYQGAREMLDLPGVFWQVSNPQVLQTAYDKNATRLMRVEPRNEQ